MHRGQHTRSRTRPDPGPAGREWSTHSIEMAADRVVKRFRSCAGNEHIREWRALTLLNRRLKKIKSASSTKQREFKSSLAKVHMVPGMMEHDQVDQPDQLDHLSKLEPHRVAVVLVDFQNDFCRPAGPDEDSAQTQPNAAAALRANDFAAKAARLGMRVVYSQQILDRARLTPRQRRWEENSTLCRAGTAGADLFIEPVTGSRTVRKYRFDIWQSQEFVHALSDWDVDGLIIGGVELICCVLYAVLGAEERGYAYVVPEDLVSGMVSSEQAANQPVRTYLQAVHPTVERAENLLHLWPATDSR